MKRVLLKVAYDGLNFHGWQLQEGLRTVEGLLNESISSLESRQIQIIGASRTDAGVHAMGNVAVFDSFSTIPADRFAYALNAQLPEDVSVVDSFEVAKDFHPRKTDTRKTYEYSILSAPFPLPFLRNISWYTKAYLDINKMREAAEFLLGEHDFKAFCSAKTEVESTVRRIYKIEILKEGLLTKIRVTGNGFLYNMVRIIAGTLVYAGSSKIAPSKVKEALESGDRTCAGITAPAQGLCLLNIDFV